MKISKLYGLALAATMLVASIAQAETLTLSTPDADNSEITLSANKFAELVSKKTDGKLKIKVFPNGTLYGGDPSAGVKQLAGGSLDMLLNSTSLYATFNPKFTAIAIPYQFRDIDQLRVYLDSELGKELSGDLSKIGILGLDLWSRPLRQITNSKAPIKSPVDLKGMKLRVPNNPLWVEFFGAMGAAPTPMAFAEVYNALQLKVVDGQENPVNVPVSAKLALTLVEAGGADPAQVRQALLGGFAESTVFRQHGKRMVEGDFRPGGPAKYQVKDTSTALAFAKSRGLSLPVGEEVDRLFRSMVEHGAGELDHSGVILEIKRMNAFGGTLETVQSISSKSA